MAISDFVFRLRTLFRPQAREHDLNDEMQFHLRNLTEKHIRVGLTPPDAARQARLDFGVEQIKEGTRESHGIDWMESTIRDLRYGARILLKSPNFTVVAVLSLALGVGANTAIFQLINAIGLRSLPVESPGQLAEIHITDRALHAATTGLTASAIPFGNNCGKSRMDFQASPCGRMTGSTHRRQDKSERCEGYG